MRASYSGGQAFSENKLRQPRESYRSSLIGRIGTAVLTTCLGVYFILVAFNNISDYQTNFSFVEHVMSMDSIPPDVSVQWRAVRSPFVHHLSYALIIAWELTAGLLSFIGGINLFRNLKESNRFIQYRWLAQTGLWVGLLIWVLPFIVIGGEWFMMWESAVWNGELAALRMFTINAFTLLFLNSQCGSESVD